MKLKNTSDPTATSASMHMALMDLIRDGIKEWSFVDDQICEMIYSRVQDDS